MTNEHLSEFQRETLRDVIVRWSQGRWSIAQTSGERVTLASLYRYGLLERRPRRGEEGAADAAHEYRPSDMVIQTWNEAGRKLVLPRRVD